MNKSDLHLVELVVKEIVADVLADLHEHPSHWCTGHGFSKVAAKLRKPPEPKVSRRVVTYTQIDEPRVPKEHEWAMNSAGTMLQAGPNEYRTMPIFDCHDSVNEVPAQTVTAVMFTPTGPPCVLEHGNWYLTSNGVFLQWNDANLSTAKRIRFTRTETQVPAPGEE